MSTGDAKALSPIERWALVYLAVPVVIFCATWFAPWFGLPCALAVVLAIGWGHRSNTWVVLAPVDGGPRLAFVCVLIGLAWAAVGGAGHWMHANTFDWIGRDAILRDMVMEPWPVKVTDPSAGGAQFWYRGPLAYYMVPAALAKFTGWKSADFFLYLWTALGVALFLMMALERIDSLAKRFAAIAVIVFFSGADAVGILLQGLSTDLVSEAHLEWWARSYQFSSNSTLLFWVPNHAIPGWIAGAWILRQWGSTTSLRWSVLVCAITVPWSPMISLGLAVMLAMSAAFGGKLDLIDKARALTSVPNLCGLLVGFVCAVYMAAGAATIPQGSGLRLAPELMLVNSAVHAFVFWALEAGLLTLAVVSSRTKGVLLACTVLFALNLAYTFGAANDWAMRGAVVPLCVLCLVVVNRLFGPDASLRQGVGGRIRVGALAALLGAGFVTPAHEFTRAIRGVTWMPSASRTLLMYAGSAANFSHFFASVDLPQLKLLMRD